MCGPSIFRTTVACQSNPYALNLWLPALQLAGENALLLKSLSDQVWPPRQPPFWWSQNQLISNLNYVCKIPSAILSDIITGVTLGTEITGAILESFLPHLVASTQVKRWKHCQSSVSASLMLPLPTILNSGSSLPLLFFPPHHICMRHEAVPFHNKYITSH